MLLLQRYHEQSKRWPKAGRHILGQFDDESIIVYQAYRPEIGEWAIENQRLAGPHFSLSRMSWIKPNFLWMMYRSGWGTKPGQEVVLALRIRRSFFESLLAASVESSFTPETYGDRDAWRRAVESSEVRLQWDPDRDPSGAPLQRRALQLGLRGSALARFAGPELLEVVDVSPLVAAQRMNATGSTSSELETPQEEVYERPVLGAD
jgi:hypothetical protein